METKADTETEDELKDTKFVTEVPLTTMPGYRLPHLRHTSSSVIHIALKQTNAVNYIFSCSL